jgi:uncharacterized YigZ family protein
VQSTYLTLKEESDGMYKEKGSKFIGLAVACYNEAEAKEKLDEWHKLHHQARHLCYAYRFGVDKSKYRANDDGEPSNSAGPPILGQIESFDLSNVLIGVVRYYGGTKLGVGGLINAYRTAAKEAITNGEIVELEVYNWVKIHFSYADMPHIMNVLKKNELSIKNKVFEDSCHLTTNLPLQTSEVILSELEKYSSLEIEELGIY